MECKENLHVDFSTCRQTVKICEISFNTFSILYIFHVVVMGKLDSPQSHLSHACIFSRLFCLSFWMLIGCVFCRFIRRLMGFCLYFCIFVIAFLLRPGTDNHPEFRQENRTVDGDNFIQNITVKDPCYLLKIHDWEDVVSLNFLLSKN